MALSTRQKEMQEAVVTLLEGMGLDPTSDDLKETPRRVVGYLEEFCQPFDEELLLNAQFMVESDVHGMVAQSEIPFRMACEHHLLPALGKAYVGYVPQRKVVGLSKLTRLVQAVGTEKPSIQEKICDRIADLLWKHLNPLGVIVVIKAEHTCMACRGANSPGVWTATSTVKGVFRDVPHARAEFFELINLKT